MNVTNCQTRQAANRISPMDYNHSSSNLDLSTRGQRSASSPACSSSRLKSLYLMVRQKSFILIGQRPGISSSSSMNTLFGMRDDPQQRQMINSNLFITGIQTLAEYFNAKKQMMDDTAATSMMEGGGVRPIHQFHHQED